MEERKYWARFRAGRTRQKIGPFPSREAAMTAMRDIPHKTGTLCVGYGAKDAWFDIQWPEPLGTFSQLSRKKRNWT